MEFDMVGGGLSEKRSLVYNIDTNFWNLFMKYLERVGVERKKRLAFLLALLLLPEAVFAAAGGNDLAMGNAVEYQYSSHITGDRWMHDETTLYFNDGFGRLIEFHLTVEHQMTELSIRQNGCVVWRGHLPGADRFSVVREESMGEVYFLISSGEKEYRAGIDRDDRWSVSECRKTVTQDKSPLPV